MFAGTLTDVTRLENTSNGNPVWVITVKGPGRRPDVIKVRSMPDSTGAYQLSPSWVGQQVQVRMHSTTRFESIALLN